MVATASSALGPPADVGLAGATAMGTGALKVGAAATDVRIRAPSDGIGTERGVERASDATSGLPGEPVVI